MEYINPTFVTGNAASDLEAVYISMAVLVVLVGGCWLMWKLSERRKAKYDAKKDEREFKEAAEEKAYRLDRHENPFSGVVGEKR